MNPLHHHTTIRLLWLSDLHIHEEYGNMSDYSTFIDHFINFYTEQNRKHSFSYIIFSGDIAFKASKKEYQVFWDSLIKGIHQVHKQQGITYPKVLTIPGNHDIDWTKDAVFENFLKKLTSGVNYDKNSFINDGKNRNEFFQCFSNYSYQFGVRKGPVWSSLFKFNPKEYKVCKGYDKHRLFGYLVDKRNKLVFILINSAWFSIGGRFNELLANLKAKGYSTALNEEVFKNILEEKDKIAEYGNQIIGRDLFDRDELLKILKLSDRYTVLTFCHHNLNWFNWTELYNVNEGAMKGLILNNILKHTDVLGTGHEHVPVNSPIYSVKEGYVHLRAGKFMDDTITSLQGVPKFENCWFSILELDCNRNIHTLSQQKFSYNGTEWAPHNQEVICRKNKCEPLTPHDVKFFCDRLASLRVESIIDLLGWEGKYGKYIEAREFKERPGFRAVYVRYTDCIRLMILPIQRNAYLELLPAQLLPGNILLALISECMQMFNGDSMPLKVNFVWSDLLVDQTLTLKYFQPADSYDDLVNEIVAKCDFDLQLFLFRFEPFLASRLLIQSRQNLQLYNTVLPAHYLMQVLQKYGTKNELLKPKNNESLKRIHRNNRK